MPNAPTPNGRRLIDSLLVANRGEIACRVIRTAKAMGLRTIAVYSDADAHALHVALADEAVRIGPAPARESYLDAAAILDAARRTGADAIHPGYGFLSENATFAQACADAGLIFIGPPPAAILAMGGKSQAKALMQTAGVPLVPGYHGEDQDPDRLAAQAAAIGFPVLIKASAGGGGKGMKVAADAGEFPSQLASARREALAAFGDNRVLIEKYLGRPRHVEIQVFADTHGDCVYLFERDCSIQRRHQKVVEEAPAPRLHPDPAQDAALRRRMGETAVAAAKAIGYVGAGTVEFLLDPVENGGDGGFYFMEMNTRLQVEHPVTEMICGQDLVEWQIRVAAGQPLPLTQAQINARGPHGHAIEVRLYAEDPAKGFLPQTGTLSHLRLPPTGPHVRVDTGVREGDAISIHYDPMIAKLIVWDEDRPSAVRRLRRALEETRVGGLAANTGFLAAIARHADFLDARLDTGFIPRHETDLLTARLSDAVRADVLALAALGYALDVRRGNPAAEGQPHSPWAATDGWRPNHQAPLTLTLRIGDDAPVRLSLLAGDDGHALEVDGVPAGDVAGTLAADGTLVARLGDIRRRCGWTREGDAITLFLDGAAHRLHLIDPWRGDETASGGDGHLRAPMPGKVIAVLTGVGQSVAQGQALMVLEAMKMEHTIKAPRDGVVAAVAYGVGDQVPDGADLLTLEET